MPEHFEINKNMRHSLFYLKNLQNVLDARAARRADIMLRKRILDTRVKQNYQL